MAASLAHQGILYNKCSVNIIWEGPSSQWSISNDKVHGATASGEQNTERALKSASVWVDQGGKESTEVRPWRVK